jgi:hypothetical protein
MATPDTPRTFEALRVRPDGAHRHQAQSQPPGARQGALILPTLGRTEIDLQAACAGVTVEDSMSMVHISYGMNKPASPNLLSEIAIVAGMAQATLGSEKMDWLRYAATTRCIRDDRASVRRFSTTTARGQAGRLPPERGLARTRVEDGQRQGAIPRHAIELDTPIQRAPRNMASA